MTHTHTPKEGKRQIRVLIAKGWQNMQRVNPSAQFVTKICGEREICATMCQGDKMCHNTAQRFQTSLASLHSEAVKQATSTADC